MSAGGGSELDAVRRSDAVIVGSGVAGLSAALGVSPRQVTLLTKVRFGGGGSSSWAQGGIAAALGADDDPALHAADTLAAGAGLNDPEIVELLTEEGPQRVLRLLALGARFDRDLGGRLALGREAAHSRRRILHAHGDSTGAEIVRAMTEAVRRSPGVEVYDLAFAEDLALDESGAVAGVVARHADGRRVLHAAPAVVLATGGSGWLFSHTTNPPEATGDGLGLAARAGALLKDLEFVQFHPTALAAAGSGPMPLLTEALRGEGAVLVDQDGVRFMTAEHADAELAPRDVVARAIWRRLAAGGRVYLDARAAVGERFPERFPTVFRLCREHGLDPRREPIPVAPAAHYHMGGIAVDARGRTSLAGLWACGEVAATGAHGANRLASNSLLEALVFGARVAEGLAEDLTAAPRRLAVAQPAAPAAATADSVASGSGSALASEVRALMWEKVGVERDGRGLTAAVDRLDRLAEASPHAAGEARNLLAAARMVAAAALARRESRGGHYRTDFPAPDPAWRRHLLVTLSAGGAVEVAAGPPEEAAPASVDLAAAVAVAR
ncbi:MAG TPA: L-aspartate oxidase [Thermoanaerobaculia bacterium]